MKSTKMLLLLSAIGTFGTVCADEIVGETEEQLLELVQGIRDMAYDCDTMSESEFRQKKSELMTSHEGATSKQFFRAFAYSVDRKNAEHIANERFAKTKCETCKIIADDFKAERESLYKKIKQ